MKTIFAIIPFSIMLCACSSNKEQNNNTEQQSPPPAPVVTTPPPAKPAPDSTSVEINDNGVQVTNKEGKSGTDVKIDRDSGHVIIKKK